MTKSSKQAVVVQNFNSSGGSIHLETRQNLTGDSVAALMDIEGVIHYDVRNYAVSFNYSAAFSWEEIMPQAALVLADALGVQVEDLELRSSSTYHESGDKDMKWVIDAAKKLKLRQPGPTQRTPLYPFALTADDVKPGTEFIRYNTMYGLRGEDTFTGAPFKTSNGFSKKATVQMATSKKSGGGVFLADLGIMPHEGILTGWNKTNFTVANTSEGRRTFVRWLLSKGGPVALEAAAKLIEKYHNDFVTVTVKVTSGTPGVTVNVTTTF